MDILGGYGSDSASDGASDAQDAVLVDDTNAADLSTREGMKCSASTLSVSEISTLATDLSTVESINKRCSSCSMMFSLINGNMVCKIKCQADFSEG